MQVRFTLLTLSTFALACGGSPAPSAVTAALSDIAVVDLTQNAFSLPMPSLAAKERADFFVGNSLFNQNWISAPASVTSRDGLGPLFNARSCSGCHFKDGRGRPPEAAQPSRALIVRLARGARGEGDRSYGAQLQTDGLNSVRPEAQVAIDYDERPGRFADGTPYSLRSPRLRVSQLAYGPLDPAVHTSMRVAPQLVGLGLLEAIPERDLAALADAEDRDRDGISGRLVRRYSPALKREAAGRFGWKAEQATVRDQTAGALARDMGITSELAHEDDCTPSQPSCREQPSGGDPEIASGALDSMVLYVRALAIPAPRPLAPAAQREGERLFAGAGCDRCHMPELTTAPEAALPALQGRRIAPFTDLLLHDMGQLLADHPSELGDAAEWRTAPLWGIGLIPRVNGHRYLLHDGRARDVNEAILFHGGEAERAKQAYRNMSQSEREALLLYVDAL